MVLMTNNLSPTALPIVFKAMVLVVLACSLGVEGRDLHASSSIVGDPHFHGFDGSHYDFEGNAGSVFNLITDTEFQLNARFVESPNDGKTYMGVMGVMLGPNKIVITPGVVLIDNVALMDSKPLQLSHGMVIRSADVVRLYSKSFNLEVKTFKDDGFLYLDLFSSVHSIYLTNPHGILGQTAKYLVDDIEPKPVRLGHDNIDAQGFLEGASDDYIVSDGLLGVQFTFNRFGITRSFPKAGRRRRFAFGQVQRKLKRNLI